MFTCMPNGYLRRNRSRPSVRNRRAMAATVGRVETRLNAAAFEPVSSVGMAFIRQSADSFAHDTEPRLLMKRACSSNNSTPSFKSR